jgi:deoxyribodipyrimidine photo-lyase
VRAHAALTATTTEHERVVPLFVGDDVSPYAQQRLRRLREQLEIRSENTVTAVALGELAPESRDHYRVFTPYWRRWREEPRPPIVDPTARVSCPDSTPDGCPS